jgi:hypothetical protein
MATAFPIEGKKDLYPTGTAPPSQRHTVLPIARLVEIERGARPSSQTCRSLAHGQHADASWHDDGGNEPRRRGRTSPRRAGGAVSLSRESLVVMLMVLARYCTSSQKSRRIIVFLVIFRKYFARAKIMSLTIAFYIFVQNSGHSNDLLSRSILPRLEDRDDLIAQVVTKYGLQKCRVQPDEDDLRKGRRSDARPRHDKAAFEYAR